MKVCVTLTAISIKQWTKVKTIFNRMKSVFQGKSKYSTVKALCHAKTVRELQDLHQGGHDFSLLRIRFIVFSSESISFSVVHSFIVDNKGRTVFDCANYTKNREWMSGLKQGILQFVDVPAKALLGE